MYAAEVFIISLIVASVLLSTFSLNGFCPLNEIILFTGSTLIPFLNRIYDIMCYLFCYIIYPNIVISLLFAIVTASFRFNNPFNVAYTKFIAFLDP